MGLEDVTFATCELLERQKCGRPDFQGCDGHCSHSACNVANTRLGQGEDVAPTVVLPLVLSLWFGSLGIGRLMPTLILSAVVLVCFLYAHISAC